MAKVISDEEFDALGGRVGRKSIYPWDQWCDGRSWALTQGEDFSPALSSFRAIAHVIAKRRAMVVETRAVSDTQIAIRFVAKGAE